MKSFIKILVSGLLFFNGVAAIWGGFNLLTMPNGSTMDWSPDMLRYSPFNDFFFPGLILLVTNGLFSFGVIWMIAVRYRLYPWFIILQGFILTGWIVVQVLLLRLFLFIHFITGLVGILIIVLGFVLKNLHEAKIKSYRNKGF